MQEIYSTIETVRSGVIDPNAQVIATVQWRTVLLFGEVGLEEIRQNLARALPSASSYVVSFLRGRMR
ncbi:hypothetical protein [Pediococcus cellicola]|uniref:Uncharacterized protein n=1 Tax=Pediococcus cellicola TaxID=319652 RepID=A0A0R2IRX9_9LACO|nr:hypothetical protein [Pediococcus cellicola]KRN66246.1 hypothetical protein IV80_GL001496 [Pediococcus cellicola]GEL15185.1 hypothetical protein PCE01_09870 [Pediococcus cellicola]